LRRKTALAERWKSWSVSYCSSASRIPAAHCRRRAREGYAATALPSTGRGQDYLAHIYGASHYTVLDYVKKLPLKIADIYRRLVS